MFWFTHVSAWPVPWRHSQRLQLRLRSLASLILKGCSDQASSKGAPFCAYPGARFSPVFRGAQTADPSTSSLDSFGCRIITRMGSSRLSEFLLRRIQQTSSPKCVCIYLDKTSLSFWASRIACRRGDHYHNYNNYIFSALTDTTHQEGLSSSTSSTGTSTSNTSRTTTTRTTTRRD